MSSSSSHFNHSQSERVNIIIPESTDSTFNLTAKNSGSTIFCDPANVATVFTLPSPEQGLNYKFIFKSSGTNDIIIVSMNSSFSQASLMHAIGTPALSTGGSPPYSSLKINNARQTIGDTLSCISDGSLWYILFNLKSTNNGAITLSNDAVTLS